MIHYSCDCCGREIDASEELRYVAKLEVYAAMEPIDVDDVEDDRDHLLEVHEILERMDDADSEEVGEEVYQKRRYDLCPECHKRFARDPFGRDLASHLDFSEN